MRVSFIYLGVVLILLFSSCNDGSKMTKVPEIKILPKENKQIKFSDFFESAEIIKLKSDSSTIVTNIWRIFPRETEKDEYILWANQKDYKVHILNSKNGILKSLIRKGKAPGDCLVVGSVFEDDGGIHIFDRMLSRLFTFNDNKHDDFKVPLDFGYHDLIEIGDSHYVLYAKYLKKQLTVVDKDFNIVNRFLPNLKNNITSERNFQQNVVLYKYDKITCYFKTFSDFVYNVYVDSITPRYKFDFGQYKLPKELYEDPNIRLMDFVKECKSSSYIWDINDFFEANNYIFYTYSFGEKKYFAFYNKNNGQCISSDKIYDDVLTHIEESEIPYYFAPIGVEGEYIYFVAEAFHLIHNAEKLKQEKPLIYKKISDKDSNLSEIYSNLSLDSNPIIIKYKFKE